MMKSQRESQDRSNQEFPSLSPKKSFSMVKSNQIIQISQNSQQSILKNSIKSKQALGTLLNNKLGLDNQSPEIVLRKSFRQDKNSQCSFFPNKRSMLQSQCMDVSSQIRSISYKESNLMQILNQISYIINELKQYKSEKGLISLIEKEIHLNSRFHDISFLFDQVKLKDLISAEQLFKRIYKQFTYSSDNRTIIKRSKLDQNFLQLLTEFLNKLEDLFRKVHESQFQGLQESMRTSRIKLQNKEIEVQNLFTSQQKRDSYQQLQSFLQSKFSINKRILESKLFKDITDLEEKNGQFKYCQIETNFFCNYCLKLIQKLLDQASQNCQLGNFIISSILALVKQYQDINLAQDLNIYIQELKISENLKFHISRSWESRQEYFDQSSYRNEYLRTQYIDQNNRFISNKIDDILKNIKY